MNDKAQASLEYLLLVAGAVLAAAIIIIFMVSSIQQSDRAKEIYHSKYNELSHSKQL